MPLEYCIKYGGNLIYDDNELQAGWKVMKASVGVEGF